MLHEILVFGVAGQPVEPEPAEPALFAPQIKLVGKLRAVGVAIDRLQLGIRPRFEVGPAEIRIRPPVEQPGVDVDQERIGVVAAMLVRNADGDAHQARADVLNKGAILYSLDPGLNHGG